MNPVLALILANIIWGGASPIFKHALENIPPFTLAFIRFFFAGLLFLPWANKVWKELTLKEWFQVFLVGFFGISINISFFFMGLQKTESINAPVIASAGPIFIYMISVVFLGEKAKLKVFKGMLLALLGVLVIIFSPMFLDGQRLILGEIQGNLLLFLATLGSVFQAIIGKGALKKVSFIQVSVITFLLSSLTFLPFIPKEFATWNLSMLDIRGWSGIIYGVFLSSAAAYTLFYYGMSKIKAQEVGLFTYIDPIIAVMIAAPLLGEYPNLYYFIGSILVFAGIYWAEGRINYHPIHKLKREPTKLEVLQMKLASLADKIYS